MQRFSLYRVHKVHARTHGRTHRHTHGTTAALLYPHRNALRGDNQGKVIKLCSLEDLLNVYRPKFKFGIIYGMQGMKFN